MVSTELTQKWGGAMRRFALPNEQVRILQNKTGVGVAKLYGRLCDGSWLVDDAREVIRCALVGGGLPPDQADALIVEYFDGPTCPRYENSLLATAICAAWLVGVRDAPRPKRKGKTSKTATTTEPDVSTSRP
jgi:hypothetical protein